MRSRGRWIRAMMSHAPSVGLVGPPSRPLGISAAVRVKNEEEWIVPSLQSVAAIADEIIVVDNGSTDRTPQLLRELERQLAPKLRLFVRPEMEVVALSNFVLAQTRYRWVLKWDGDFVAHTSGPRAITGLRQRLFALPANRYYHIHLTCVEVMGDLWHQCPGWETRADPFVTVFSPQLRYVRVVRRYPRRDLVGWPSILRNPEEPVVFRFEDIRVPLYYQVLWWEEAYFFHLQVKRAMRMYLRDCWGDWAENPPLQRAHANLEAYALKRAQEAWGVRSLEEAAEEYMRRMRALLAPYSRERFGDHPELLKPHLQQQEPTR